MAQFPSMVALPANLLRLRTAYVGQNGWRTAIVAAMSTPEIGRRAGLPRWGKS
ncbi:hypothetical protein GFPCMMHI_04978 [Ensifer adhaerens]|nr:hypothetical protein [Ensifer adhaerens]